MTNFKGGRARLGGLLVVAIGALSIFVLPGLASARDGSVDSDSSATIKSFDQATKTLVVALPDGQSVNGTVTRRTKIRCEDESGHRRGGHGVRSREAEPGDDHGGRGNEAGDDNGDGSSGPSSSGPSAHDDNGSGANCGAADLVAGAAVEELDLEFRGDIVVFDEVELDD